MRARGSRLGGLVLVGWAPGSITDHPAYPATPGKASARRVCAGLRAPSLRDVGETLLDLRILGQPDVLPPHSTELVQDDRRRNGVSIAEGAAPGEELSVGNRQGIRQPQRLAERREKGFVLGWVEQDRGRVDARRMRAKYLRQEARLRLGGHVVGRQEDDDGRAAPHPF